MGRFIHDLFIPRYDIRILGYGLYGRQKRSCGMDSDICTLIFCIDDGNLRDSDQSLQNEVAGDICVVNQHDISDDICRNYYASYRLGKEIL